jgi:hypothetical protein
VDEILAGIDEIDWSALTHAYGPGTDTPEQLRAALGGDVDAIGKLDASLYHQGGCVYPAGAAAVPFLVNLACEPTFAHRPAALEILTSFAGLLEELNEPWRSRTEAESLRVTMAGALPRFIALLDDPAAVVRGTTVEFLTAYGTETGLVIDALRRRFMAETDRHQRVVLVTMLGEMAGRLSTEERADLAAWIAEATARDARVLLAALIARESLLPGTVASSKVFDALVHAALVPSDYLVKAETPQDLVAWVSHRYGDSDFQWRLCLWALKNARTGDAKPALLQASKLMHRSRQTTGDLLPQIAELLDHPLPVTRSGAAHLMAAAGQASAPFTNRLVAAIDDPDTGVATRAIWALARLGDDRVVAHVAAAIGGEPVRFPISRVYYSMPVFMLIDLPGLADVLPPMKRYADALIPAVRRRLAQKIDVPTLHTLTEVLVGFGRPALAALPELRALLDTSHRALACRVIGELGPDATEAAEDLHRLATTTGLGADPRDGATLAWAYFKVTGDAAPFLRAISLEQGISTPHEVFRQIADLGPRASTLADTIAELLHTNHDYWDGWTGVEAARAHWRITGDAGLCIEVFDAALDPLRHGRQLPVSRQVLRYLPALGGAAGAFRPLLEEMIARPERLVYSGGWRGLAEDDEAVGLARAALDA